jgi:hypothetical protein
MVRPESFPRASSRAFRKSFRALRAEADALRAALRRSSLKGEKGRGKTIQQQRHEAMAGGGVPESLIDVVEPFFRVIVELGCDRSIPPWEPTPARLIPMHDPVTAGDLIDAIGKGNQQRPWPPPAGEHRERADQVERLDAGKADDEHRSRHASIVGNPTSWVLRHGPANQDKRQPVGLSI